jgi:hypothetical protein
MTVQAILAPLFVLVALTFALLVWMGAVRFAAVRRREVRVSDIALGTELAAARAADFQLLP